jgi:hypothetical protein
MSEDTLLPFDLPSIARKKLSVGFDGGQLSSDAGVLLLRGVEMKLGLAGRLSSCIRDRRNPERIEHPLEEMLRLRMFAIAAGYEDADDCDWLRYDPIFKMAVGHAPESGDPLCSQPTMSRLENAPSNARRHAVGAAEASPGSAERSVCVPVRTRRVRPVSHHSRMYSIASAHWRGTQARNSRRSAELVPARFLIARLVLGQQALQRLLSIGFPIRY